MGRSFAIRAGSMAAAAAAASGRTEEDEPSQGPFEKHLNHNKKGGYL